MEDTIKAINLVLSIAVYSMYFLNIHTVMKSLLDGNRFKKISYAIVLLNGFLMICSQFMDVSPLFVKLVVYSHTPLTVLAIYLSHDRSFLRALYVTALYLSIDSCVGATLNIIADNFIPEEYKTLSGTVTFALINIFFYWFVPRFILSKKDEIVLSMQLIPGIIYVLILSYAVILSFFCSFIRSFTTIALSSGIMVHILKICIIIVGVISFFIIVFLIVNSISKFYYKRSAELLDKQLDMQVKYYEKVEQMTSDIRKFRHDYKNHMHCLNSLLKNGDQASALEYLSSISGDPVMNKHSFRSGNTIADAILNDKAEIAAKENCTLRFSGAISENITAFDICTILSNAIDNAIEACQRLDGKAERYVDVKCMMKNDMQLICISNPSNTQDPDLRTSKTNKAEHGFGLYNIRKTVEALGGTVNISRTSPVFVLDVIFRV